MRQRKTEQFHTSSRGIDARPPREAATLLARAQAEAAATVPDAAAALSAAATALAGTLGGSGRVCYVGAGSSGLMAAADAMELGGTFGISPARVRIAMAGGLPAGAEMPGASEDDPAGLAAALSDLGPQDCVIAVSASGETPYTVEAARMARAVQATVIGVANNAPSTLLDLSDIAIHLDTPPEVVSGSTRLGAGTAQKIALNCISTLAGILLGHVHDGMMVNLRADNAKLRGRAVAMVQTIASVDAARARAALDRTGGAVKPAVLLATGVADPAEARAMLAAADGRLRAALAQLEEKT